MSFTITIDVDSLWPAHRTGHATATCSCGWVWEEQFHGPVWDLGNCSAVASADQLNAAVRQHEQGHQT